MATAKKSTETKAPKRNEDKVSNVETAPVSVETENENEDVKPEVKQEAKTKENPVITEEFSSQKLHMIADRLFRYDCQDIKAIKKDFFLSDAAKAFGLRKGDLVILVDSEETKNLVV